MKKNLLPLLCLSIFSVALADTLSAQNNNLNQDQLNVSLVGEQTDFRQGTVTVPESSADQTRVKVYPNPMKSATTFEITGGTQDEFTIELFDLSVRRVRIVQNIRSTTWSLQKEDLTNGVYIYKVSGRKGVISIGKLVIQD